MLKNLKRMLVWIPCMIFGLFVCTSISVSAANAEMVDVHKVVVGEDTRENTYYFTKDNSWEFSAEFSLVAEWDTFLKYRVITPEGKATPWSDKQEYVNNGGKFHISDYTTLDYSETEDVSSRNSVAPAGTYYVDIKYYGAYLFIEWDQNKDETIKVIVGDIDSFSYSKAELTYNNGTKEFTVEAATQNENGKGYSIIENVRYYFSEVTVDNAVSNFVANMENSPVNGLLEFTPASSVSLTIDRPEEAAYKYLYVMVSDGNGNSRILSYDLTEDNQGPSQEGEEKEELSNPSDEDGTGIFDFNFGELILLVLVVVLIVSCALIITQKLVDYKKRLY